MGSPRPECSGPAPLLLLSALMLAACTTSATASRTRAEAEPDDTISCDDANAGQCAVLACDKGECAFFGSPLVAVIGSSRMSRRSSVDEKGDLFS